MRPGQSLPWRLSFLPGPLAAACTTLSSSYSQLCLGQTNIQQEEFQATSDTSRTDQDSGLCQHLHGFICGVLSVEKTSSRPLVYFRRSHQSLSQGVVWTLHPLIYRMLSKSRGSLPSGLPKFLQENSCSGIGKGWAQAGLPVFPKDSWETQKWAVLVCFVEG